MGCGQSYTGVGKVVLRRKGDRTQIKEGREENMRVG